MKLYINSEPVEIEDVTLLNWLQNQKINLNEIVVEYNGQILIQEQWSQTYLKAEDHIEVLRFVGGG